MAAASGRARRWPGEGQPRSMSDTACAIDGATLLLHDEYKSHRTWLLFTCPAANLASRHTPETVTPSLGRDCAFARRQKWLPAKQQHMMILGGFFPSVPPPRLRKDVRRAALQYGKYTMSDLMLVFAYRERTAHSEPEGGYGCRTPIGSRPKIRGW